MPTLASFDFGQAKGLIKKYSWPKDRVTDELQLLPVGQEVQLNYFLKKLKESEGISVNFVFTASLKELSIEDASIQWFANNPPLSNEGETGSLTYQEPLQILFFLSLSDRQFILSSNRSDTVFTELVKNELVSVIRPSLTRQDYPETVEIFLKNLIFHFNPQSQLRVPNIGIVRGYNKETLFFFLATIFLIFTLGHQIRKGLALLGKSKNLVKKKDSPFGVFWS